LTFPFEFFIQLYIQLLVILADVLTLLLLAIFGAGEDVSWWMFIFWW